MPTLADQEVEYAGSEQRAEAPEVVGDDSHKAATRVSPRNRRS